MPDRNKNDRQTDRYMSDTYIVRKPERCQREEKKWAERQTEKCQTNRQIDR